MCTFQSQHGTIDTYTFAVSAMKKGGWMGGPGSSLNNLEEEPNKMNQGYNGVTDYMNHYLSRNEQHLRRHSKYQYNKRPTKSESRFS